MTGSFEPGWRATLWTSAALGLVVGLVLQPCMQWSVELAQVLAGTVAYPETDLRSGFARTAWSITALGPAWLLRLGVSEVAIHLLLSAIGGALSFAGVSACSLLFSGSRLLALLVPFVYYHLAVVGHRYPVLFGAHIENTGVLGLFVALLAVSLFLLDRRATAAFLLGAVASVHASVAIPAWLIVGTVLATDERLRAGLGRREAIALGAGLAVTAGVVATYAVFWPASPTPAEAVDPELILALMTNWDFHRAPLPDWGSFARAAEVDVYMLIATGALAWAGDRVPRTARLLTRGLLVVTCVSIAVAAVEQFAPESVPLFLRRLMIRRWMNLNSVVFPILVIGLLGHFAMARRRPLAAAGLLAVLVASTWPVPQPTTMLYWQPYRSVSDPGTFPTDPRTIVDRRYEFAEVHADDLLFGVVSKRGLVYPAGWLCLMFLILDDGRRARGRPEAVEAVGVLGRRTAAAAMAGVALVLAANLAWRGYEALRAERLSGFLAYMDLLERADTPLLSAIREGDGHLLVPPNFVEYSQLHTRRRTLYEIGNSDATLGYLPGEIAGAERILNDVFGATFRNPLQHPMRRVRRLWASRSPEEWAALAERYGFTQIVVRSQLGLRLEKVADDGTWSLYEVPGPAGRPAS